MNPIPRISGIDELYHWFGTRHDFHDAEILEVHLNRHGTSIVRLHTWRMTEEVGPDGAYVHEKNAIVTIGFDDITDLEISGFSHQNVIESLDFTETDAVCRVSFDPCYGLSGFIEAERVTVAWREE